MKPALKIVVVILLILPFALAGYAWYLLQPKQQILELPDGLIAVDSAVGQAVLASADCTIDYPVLSNAWEAQELVSYCGVASGVTVLNALGEPANQFNFFNDDTDAVRSRLDVTFGGMSLPDLAGLLQARGMEVGMFHGDSLTASEFRDRIASNLCRAGDYMLVNYQRESLGQGRVGHISPLGAYNSATDQVLIMDTADYKYPHTWVKVASLHAALQEKDRSTDRSRGIVEVGRPTASD
jgi:hypothetical protein